MDGVIRAIFYDVSFMTRLFFFVNSFPCSLSLLLSPPTPCRCSYPISPIYSAIHSSFPLRSILSPPSFPLYMPLLLPQQFLSSLSPSHPSLSSSFPSLTHSSPALPSSPFLHSPLPTSAAFLAPSFFLCPCTPCLTYPRKQTSLLSLPSLHPLPSLPHSFISVPSVFSFYPFVRSLH